MAIVLEEEKNKKSWGTIFGFILVAAIIGAAVYYVFFVNPPVAEVFLPSRLRSISEFEKINLDFNNLLGNPKFSSLKSLVEFIPASEGTIGKINPFQP